MREWMNSCGFQTQDPDLVRQLMQVKENSKVLRYLISGEQGSGRKQFAQFLLDHHRPQTITRITKNSDFAFVSAVSSQAVIVENLSQLHAREQQQLFKMMRADATRDESKHVLWIILADEDIKSLSAKGLIDQRIMKNCDLEFHIPALRDRIEDIPLIAENILQTQSWISGRVLKLSPAAKMKLKSYSWPGNISEFEEILVRATRASTSGIIQEKDLQIESQENGQLCTLAEMERKLILQTLQVTKQNKTKAAEVLGISIRTLRNKLSQYREEENHESNV